MTSVLPDRGIRSSPSTSARRPGIAPNALLAALILGGALVLLLWWHDTPDTPAYVRRLADERGPHHRPPCWLRDHRLAAAHGAGAGARARARCRPSRSVARDGRALRDLVGSGTHVAHHLGLRRHRARVGDPADGCVVDAIPRRDDGDSCAGAADSGRWRINAGGARTHALRDVVLPALLYLPCGSPLVQPRVLDRARLQCEPECASVVEPALYQHRRAACLVPVRRTDPRGHAASHGGGRRLP